MSEIFVRDQTQARVTNPWGVPHESSHSACKSFQRKTKKHKKQKKSKNKSKKKVKQKKSV